MALLNTKPESKKSKASSYDATRGQAQGYSADQSAQAQGYDAQAGQAQGYGQDQRSVQRSGTVRGQMEDLLAGDGRYMQVARANADQRSNARGLLFSSMAVGAGEKAAIESAMPIAAQDASTYSNQSLTNQQASNQASQYNAGNRQQMEVANMDAQNRAGEFNAANRQQASLANQSANNQAQQFSAGNRQQMQMANMDADNQAGQFNANARMNTRQFNASQANSMAQSRWSQEERQAHDETMASLSSDLERGIIDQKAYANLRGQFLDSYTSIVNEANINISEIQTSDAIPAKEKEEMINQQMAFRSADLDGIEGLFKEQPMWHKNWSGLAQPRARIQPYRSR